MHSCTVRCRKETSYRKDMESLTPTNRTATSKQFQDRKKREKAQRPPRRGYHHGPEVEAPSRTAKPVPASPASPLWCPQASGTPAARLARAQPLR